MKNHKMKTEYDIEEMVKVFHDESAKSNHHSFNAILGNEDYMKAKQKENMKFEPRMVDGNIVSIDLIKK